MKLAYQYATAQLKVIFTTSGQYISSNCVSVCVCVCVSAPPCLMRRIQHDGTLRTSNLQLSEGGLGPRWPLSCGALQGQWRVLALRLQNDGAPQVLLSCPHLARVDLVGVLPDNFDEGRFKAQFQARQHSGPIAACFLRCFGALPSLAKPCEVLRSRSGKAKLRRLGMSQLADACCGTQPSAALISQVCINAPSALKRALCS